MPRKLTEDEICVQKDYMYQKTIQLIRKKGLRNVTLEDITNASLMAKGSFYHYYHSKEEFLFEVIKRDEKQSFDSLLYDTSDIHISRECVMSVFKNTFLSEDCLFGCILPEDLEYLLRHLPNEFREAESLKSHTNYDTIQKLFHLRESDDNFATLSYLLDALQAVIRDPAAYGEGGRKRAEDKIANLICDFFMEEREISHPC